MGVFAQQHDQQHDQHGQQHGQPRYPSRQN
jgi:hypothetical protein